jgi:hypothetical protein
MTTPITKASVIQAYEEMREKAREMGIPTRHWQLQVGNAYRPWRLFTYGDPDTGGTTLGALDDGSLLGKTTREAYECLRGIRAGLFAADNQQNHLAALHHALGRPGYTTTRQG